MFVIGCVLNIDGLGFEVLGVELGCVGEVVVDDYSQIVVLLIYVVGDVINCVQLIFVVICEGMVFVDIVFNGKLIKVDYELILLVVFIQFEFGIVGLFEEVVSEVELIEVYVIFFCLMQILFVGCEDKVLMKLIVSKVLCKVLGCYIVVLGVGEMIQFVGIVVKMGVIKEDFDCVCVVYLIMLEELVIMKVFVRMI